MGRAVGKRYGDEGWPIVMILNLDTDFGKALPANSNAILRVYHNKEKSKERMLCMTGRLESPEGSVFFSRASCYF